MKVTLSQLIKNTAIRDVDKIIAGSGKKPTGSQRRSMLRRQEKLIRKEVDNNPAFRQFVMDQCKYGSDVAVEKHLEREQANA